MNSRFLLLFTASLFAATSGFGVRLWLQIENARLGYEVSDLQTRGAQLAAQRNLLALEAATLRQVDRVELVARGTFGMEVPSASRVIAVNTNAVRNSGKAP